MSHATVLASMAQQVSMTMGVAIAVVLLNISLYAHRTDKLGANDFWLAFSVIGLLSANAIWFFARLPVGSGGELAEKVY